MVAGLIYIPAGNIKEFLSTHILSIAYLMVAFPAGDCNHNAVLISISLMAKDAEHFSVFLLVICTACFHSERSFPSY